MDKKNIKFVTVEEDFHIGGSATFEIVEKFKRLIDAGILDPKLAILCTIKYDTTSGNAEKGPVCIYFLNGIRVRLNLTAGYDGTGPKHTCQVLELCGFDFNKDDILSHQEVVDIKYYKDIGDDSVYQFATYDGSYEYSSM